MKTVTKLAMIMLLIAATATAEPKKVPPPRVTSTPAQAPDRRHAVTPPVVHYAFIPIESPWFPCVSRLLRRPSC